MTAATPELRMYITNTCIPIVIAVLLAVCTIIFAVRSAKGTNPRHKKIDEALAIITAIGTLAAILTVYYTWN